MIVEREERHEAGGTREKIITFVDGKPRFERERFPSLLRFAFQAIRDRSRLIPRTSLASASFLRSTFSTVPPSSPIVREIRRTRQLETTFLTCNVISYVPLALQRPETPGADNNETASATRSSCPLLPAFSLETRLSAGEEVEITLKARLCGRHCIDLARRGSARHAKAEINPGPQVEQVRALNSAASRD